MSATAEVGGDAVYDISIRNTVEVSDPLRPHIGQEEIQLTVRLDEDSIYELVLSILECTENLHLQPLSCKDIRHVSKVLRERSKSRKRLVS